MSCRSHGSDIACAGPGAIIADHTTTDLSAIPPEWVEAAKDQLKVWYGHTSHGGQILSGMEVLADGLFAFNGGPGTLSIFDPDPWVGDLGDPNSTAWASTTRTVLDRPDNDRNVIMWSWCGQVSARSEETLRRDYLELMTALEEEYPEVLFVYMTGHLDGTGVDGNLNVRNEQIRAHCLNNEKILLDFADIESYDPDGNYFLDKGANDNCDYTDPEGGGQRNWALEWCAAHPGECPPDGCFCAHSRCLNCILKGRAFWWMAARMAGWPGPDGGR